MIAGTGLTGGGVNGRVTLSIDTISSANISNGAGVAWVGPITATELLPDPPSSATVGLVSISAPSAGFVVVNASGSFRNFTTLALAFQSECAITIDSTVFPSIRGTKSLAGVFPNPEVPFAITLASGVAAGNHMIRLLCRVATDASQNQRVTVGSVSMTALFVPTEY